MLELYLSHLKSISRSTNTIENHRFQLKAFFRWVNKDPSSVTEQDIRDYLNHRERKPRTWNQLRSAIHAFYSWMKEEGYLDIIPTDGVKRVEMPETRLWLTPKQRLKLIRAVDSLENQRDISIVLTILMAGLRFKELARLKHQDVILGDKEGVIVVKEEFPRQVKIPKQLCRVLGEYLKQYPIGEYLFTTVQDNPLSPYVLFNICDKLSKKLKFNVTGETLRQTYGYELAQNNVPVHIIAHQMGYTRNATALKYFEWIDEYQRKRNNGPVERMQRQLKSYNNIE